MLLILFALLLCTLLADVSVCAMLLFQDNQDDGQINWELFTQTELENFLRVLDVEENEHISQVWANFRCRFL